MGVRRKIATDEYRAPATTSSRVMPVLKKPRLCLTRLPEDAANCGSRTTRYSFVVSAPIDRARQQSLTATNSITRDASNVVDDVATAACMPNLPNNGQSDNGRDFVDVGDSATKSGDSRDEHIAVSLIDQNEIKIESEWCASEEKPSPQPLDNAQRIIDLVACGALPGTEHPENDKEAGDDKNASVVNESAMTTAVSHNADVQRRGAIASIEHRVDNEDDKNNAANGYRELELEKAVSSVYATLSDSNDNGGERTDMEETTTSAEKIADEGILERTRMNETTTIESSARMNANTAIQSDDNSERTETASEFDVEMDSSPNASNNATERTDMEETTTSAERIGADEGIEQPGMNETTVTDESDAGICEKDDLFKALRQSTTLSDQLEILRTNEAIFAAIVTSNNSLEMDGTTAATTAENILLILLDSYQIELSARLASAAAKANLSCISSETSSSTTTMRAFGNCEKRLLNDSTLARYLWYRVTSRDFWRVIYPRMCDIAFFACVPQSRHDQCCLLTSRGQNFLASRSDSTRIIATNASNLLPSFLLQPSSVSTSTTAAATTAKTTTNSAAARTLSSNEKRANAYVEEETAIADDDEHERDNLRKAAERECQADMSDMVFRAMWPEFATVLTAFSRVIWTRLMRDVLNDSVDRSEATLDLIADAYEYAAMKGHVVLAAPLSLCASLDVVNTANFMQIEKLRDCLDGRYCGAIFDSSVLFTMLASIHYAVLARGFRTLDLWPVVRDPGFQTDCSFTDAQLCPWFLIKNTAFGVYHAQRAFVHDELAFYSTCGFACDTAHHRNLNLNEDYCDDKDDDDDDCCSDDPSSRRNSASRLRRIIDIVRGHNVDNEYRRFRGEPKIVSNFELDDRELYELAGYMNLRIPNTYLFDRQEACLSDATHLYNRHLLKVRYDSAHCLLWNTQFVNCPNFDCDRISDRWGIQPSTVRSPPLRTNRRLFPYNWDDEIIPATPPREQRRAEQNRLQRERNNMVGARAVVNENEAAPSAEPDSTDIDAIISCPFYEIAHNSHLTTTDKHQLLHNELVNLLLVAPPSRHRDELLRFQLRGVRSFPTRAICLREHLRSMKVLFLRYTTSLMSIPRR